MSELSLYRKDIMLYADYPIKLTNYEDKSL